MINSEYSKIIHNNEEIPKKFVLGHDVWKSINHEAIGDTFANMMKCDLGRPPFDFFCAEVNANAYDYNSYLFTKESIDPLDKNKNITAKYAFVFDEENINNFVGLKNYGFGWLTDEKIAEIRRNEGIFKEDVAEGRFLTEDQAENVFIEYMFNEFVRVYALLIVLLFTKNVLKNSTRAFKKNNGKKLSFPAQDYQIITIKVGKITETMRSDGATVSPVRPHLRRGHIRNQHYGVGNKEVKQIFIQPVFVNADEGWIENHRKEYRIKL